MTDDGWRMTDVGCRMSDAGCRMSDAGCRMTDELCPSSSAKRLRSWIFPRGAGKRRAVGPELLRPAAAQAALPTSFSFL
ncbi:MAG: hypothetical protein KJ626_01015, partial [Verrucomicrobia bacterium]|nr:hypothetical protein [Verrucomicrobiota bacterium]